MNKKNKINKIILISVLVVSLVGFNFPVFLVLAEGENATSTGEIVEEEGEQDVGGNSTGGETEDPVLDYTGQSSSTEEMGGGSSTTTEEASTSTDSLGEPSSTTTESTATSSENSTSTEELGGQAEEDEVIKEVVDNEAEVKTEIENEAVTGENEVTGNGDGDAVVFTGNANIVVGVMNTANSNITESDFSQFLYNAFGAVEGDLNLGEQINLFSGGFCLSGATCSHLVSDSEGNIENNVLIKALTGANAASTDSGVAYINTGNINVVADIFNVLNSNIIGSNWTKFIINIFNDWEGDLIMPSSYALEEFANQSSEVCGGNCNGTSTVESNEMQINNNVSVTVDTGQNTVIARDGSGIIDTGIASAQSNISNIANSNIEDGNYFFMAVNNFGTWQGNIFSLPAGYEISEDAQGIKIYNVGPDQLAPGSGKPSSSIVRNNSGSIKNSVIINVSTGGNKAEAGDGTGYIQTGHASVLTDIMNILNSNVIGSNWLSGMVNIFGSWQGDLAFGRPDLWLAESAETEDSPTKPGQTITYTLTYKNNGDAPATGVKLLDDFDEKFVSVEDTGGGTVIDNPGEIEWDLGTLEAGETGSVSYTVNVNSDIPGGNNKIQNEASVDSHEDDWDDGDNTDSLSLDVYKFVSHFEGMPYLWYRPKLKITKEYLGESPITPPANADYRITLVNDSFGPALGVMVEDNLVNEDLQIVNTYRWDLGYVFPGEKIVINYTIGIGKYVAPGVYTNYAEAVGVNQKGEEVKSSLSVREIEVLPAPQEEGVTWEEVKEEMEKLDQRMEMIKQELQRTKPETPPQPGSQDIVKEVVKEVANTEQANAMGGEELYDEPSNEGKTTTQEVLVAEEPGIGRWVFDFLANIGAIIWQLLGDKVNSVFHALYEKITALTPQLTSFLLVLYGFWRSIRA